MAPIPGRQHMCSRTGFTLVELVLVLVIVGVVTALALPVFAKVRRGWRIESATQQLVGDLQRARVEAIKRNEVVYLAKSGPTTYAIRFVGVRELPKGVSFGSEAPDTVKFAPFGPTLTGGATYDLRFHDNTGTVELTAAGAASVRRGG